MEELFDRHKALLHAKLDGMIKPDDRVDLDQLLKLQHGLIDEDSYLGWYKNYYANRVNK